MDSWKSRWGVGQWAAYFENQALPVMRRSNLLMTQLESREGEMLSPRDLSEIVLQERNPQCKVGGVSGVLLNSSSIAALSKRYSRLPRSSRMTISPRSLSAA